MATSSKPPLNAFNTALVLMPPREIALRLNPFRITHDKAGLRWPAHITMIFPFVEPMYLPETISNLREAVKTIQPFQLRLDKVGKFPKRDYDTVHLTIGKKSDQQNIQNLWKALAITVGYQGRPFAPHLTLGQASTKRGTDSLQFLSERSELMLERVKNLDWQVGKNPFNHVMLKVLTWSITQGVWSCLEKTTMTAAS
jgi:2'-5' RNA ligase